MPPRRRTIRRQGFTLIEMTAVLLIAAIASAVVVLRLQGTRRTLEMDEAVAETIAFDRFSRHLARRRGRELLIRADLAAGRLSRVETGTHNQAGRPLELPREFRIARLRLGDRRASIGSVTWTVTPAGLSPTVAMELAGPGGRREWIVLPGLGGAAWQTDDERDIDAIWETTFESGRHHAG